MKVKFDIYEHSGEEFPKSNLFQLLFQKIEAKHVYFNLYC